MLEILIASDHAGFELKAEIIKYLQKNNLPVKDLGCNSKDSVDYPDFAKKLADEITNNQFGILICGSGIGISIAANRFKNIRAALCTSEQMAMLSRLHNDANVICFGARIINQNDAIKALAVFLNTEFEGKRHVSRIQKMS
jgi:ribose 5-phosphate isomerase B